MNRRFLSLLSVPALIATVGLSTVSTARAEVVGKSIATVNGEAIYSSEFEDTWQEFLDEQQRNAPQQELTADQKKTSRKALLDQLIEQKLLVQEANRQKVTVPKRQLEEGIRQVKNRFKDLPDNGKQPSKEDYERDLTPKEQQAFEEELKKQGITEKQFESKIEDQLKVMRLTETDIRGKVPQPFKDGGNVTEDKDQRELTPEYERRTKDLYAQVEKKFNDKDFKPDPDNEIDQLVDLLRARLAESVHARHIMIKSSRTDDPKKRAEALKKAQEIKKELDNGADFVELANKKSEGPSQGTGGDLGFFTRGQLSPEFEKAAFALPVGGISDVVETEHGYHIIMVEEKRAAKRLRYDDIKMDLAAYLYQSDLRKRFEEYVGNLRKKADVKILVDLDKADKG